MGAETMVVESWLCLLQGLDCHNPAGPAVLEGSLQSTVLVSMWFSCDDSMPDR